MFPHCRWSNDRFECKYKKLKKSIQLCLKSARKQITWLSFLLRFVAITNLLPGYPVLSKNYKRGDRVQNGNRQVLWTLTWKFGQSQFFQAVFNYPQSSISLRWCWWAKNTETEMVSGIFYDKYSPTRCCSELVFVADSVTNLFFLKC